MKQKHTVIARCYDKRGNLISIAENSYTKTHPLQAYFAARVGHKDKIYLHAEVRAIIKAGGKHIHSIHVERRNKKGQPLDAHPCPICMEAIKAFGIKHLTYTLEI